MGNIASMHNVKPLLQVHASAEGLVTCTREDSASQFGLSVIPFPQCTELYRCFDREAVAVLGAVDGHLQNVFSGEADDAVFDVRIRRFYPAWDGILCSWGRHCENGFRCLTLVRILIMRTLPVLLVDHQSPSLKKSKSRSDPCVSLRLVDLGCPAADLVSDLASTAHLCTGPVLMIQ